MQDRDGEIRLGALLAELSFALDLAEGQAAGHALRACLIGMTLAERVGLGPEERSQLYYGHLLKDAGCSSNASRIAALLAADDQTVKRALKLTDWTRFPDRVRYAAQVVAPGAPPRERLRRLAVLARKADAQSVFVRLRCERGAEIAAGLGFPQGTADAIRALDEHWDGKGHPDGLRGTRSRSPRASCAWRRPSTCSPPRTASRGRWRSRASGAGPGSTPRSSTCSTPGCCAGCPRRPTAWRPP